MQDEPPTWAGGDDSDEDGLQSVSEPDPEDRLSQRSSDDEDDDLRETTAGGPTAVGGRDDDGDAASEITEATTRIKAHPPAQSTPFTHETPKADMPKNATSSPGKASTTETTSAQHEYDRVGDLAPNRPSILPAQGARSRLDSWVQPEPEGEAPNGAAPL